MLLPVFIFQDNSLTETSTSLGCCIIMNAGSEPRIGTSNLRGLDSEYMLGVSSGQFPGVLGVNSSLPEIFLFPNDIYIRKIRSKNVWLWVTLTFMLLTWTNQFKVILCVCINVTWNLNLKLKRRNIIVCFKQNIFLICLFIYSPFWLLGGWLGEWKCQ